MDSMEYRINWWWLGISRIFGDILDIFSRTIGWSLLIKCLLCTYIYVALTVLSNYYDGYCKPFCRVDYVIPYAWCCGQRDVYTSHWGYIHQHEHQHNERCTVYFRHISLMFGGEFFGWNRAHSTVSKDAEKFR